MVYMRETPGIKIQGKVTSIDKHSYWMMLVVGLPTIHTQQVMYFYLIKHSRQRLDQTSTTPLGNLVTPSKSTLPIMAYWNILKCCTLKYFEIFYIENILKYCTLKIFWNNAYWNISKYCILKYFEISHIEIFWNHVRWRMNLQSAWIKILLQNFL